MSLISYHILWNKTHGGGKFAILTCILYLSGIWHGITGLSTTAICFFTIGAAYATSGKLLIDMPKTAKILLYIVTFACFLTANLTHNGIIQNMFILSSAMTWITLSSKIPERLTMALNKITPSVFFIYAIHNTFVLANTSKLLMRFVDEKTCFWLSPVLTMIVCILIWKIMSFLLPKTTRFVCGGR